MNKITTLIDFSQKIAQQLDNNKNKGLSADNIRYNAHKSVWWKCSKGSGHEWKEKIYNRTIMGYKCPFCVNRRVSITNSLSVLYPEIAKEFHLKLNDGLTSDDIIATSGIKRWWKCNKGSDHEWETRVYNRAIRGTGCPFCVNQKVSVTNSLISLYPEIAKEYDTNKNQRPLKSIKVIDRWHYLWICLRGHTFSQSPVNRTTKNKHCENQICINERVLKKFGIDRSTTSAHDIETRKIDYFDIKDRFQPYRGKRRALKY